LHTDNIETFEETGVFVLITVFAPNIFIAREKRFLPCLEDELPMMISGACVPERARPTANGDGSSSIIRQKGLIKSEGPHSVCEKPQFTFI